MIVVAGGVIGPSPAERAAEQDKAIATPQSRASWTLRNGGDLLSTKDQDFLKNMRTRRKPSEKQLRWLDDLVNRVRG